MTSKELEQIASKVLSLMNKGTAQQQPKQTKQASWDVVISKTGKKYMKFMGSKVLCVYKTSSKEEALQVLREALEN